MYDLSTAKELGIAMERRMMSIRMAWVYSCSDVEAEDEEILGSPRKIPNSAVLAE